MFHLIAICGAIALHMRCVRERTTSIPAYKSARINEEAQLN